jgi:hypothetical protein
MGWTDRLEVTAPTNGLANGYLVPGRTGAASGGFLTSPAGGEEYYYVVEMTPTDVDDLGGMDTQSGPLMSPVLDDVVVLYAPWATARVLSEAEVGGE